MQPLLQIAQHLKPYYHNCNRDPLAAFAECLFYQENNLYLILKESPFQATHLFSAIIRVEQKSFEEKVSLLKLITPYFPVDKILVELATADPHAFVLILSSWDDHHLKNRVISTMGNDFLTLLECWRFIVYNGDKHSQKAFNQILLLFPDDTLKVFAEYCFKNAALKELGKLFVVIEMEGSASFFTEAFFTLCYSNENLKSLIEALAKGCHKKKSPFFSQLIAEKQGEICSLIPDLTKGTLAIVLRLLPVERLKIYLKEHKKQFTESLTALYELCTNLEEGEEYARLFLSLFNSQSELNLWLKELINTRSTLIPYLWLGFSDDQLNLLINTGDINIRSQLLRLSMPSSMDHLKGICKKLNPKASLFLTKCRLDIVSQTSLRSGYGSWLTFTELESYFGENRSLEDIENMITFFEEDLHRVPPFLFALATLQNNNKWLVKSAPYLTNDQLKSFSSVLEDIEALDLFLKTMKQHQWKQVLESVSPDLLHGYYNHVYQKILQEGGKIQAMHGEIQDGIQYLSSNTLPDISEFIEQTIELCRKELQLIGYILNPLYWTLSHYWEPLAILIRTTEAYKRVLEGEFGSFQILQNLKPKKSSSITSIPTSFYKAFGINTLDEVGIISPDDLIQFESAGLESYFSQPDLKEIWKFLKIKRLHRIETLIDTSIVSCEDDLLNLEAIAKKLGWKE